MSEMARGDATRVIGGSSNVHAGHVCATGVQLHLRFGSGIVDCSSDESPSSRGPGRGPFKAETRVRIPVGTPIAMTRGQAVENSAEACIACEAIAASIRLNDRREAHFPALEELPEHRSRVSGVARQQPA